MPDFDSLAAVRAEIDRLDQALLRTLAERAACVHAAARYKTSEVEVRAPDRLAAMIEARRGWAGDLSLDPDFAEALFRLVTSHFIGRELGEWARASAPASEAQG